MQHTPIDREARATRFLSALDGLSNLISGQVPDMTLGSEQLQGLLDLIAAEAHEVVGTASTTRYRAND